MASLVPHQHDSYYSLGFDDVIGMSTSSFITVGECPELNGGGLTFSYFFFLDPVSAAAISASIRVWPVATR